MVQVVLKQSSRQGGAWHKFHGGRNRGLRDPFDEFEAE
jgi:hypothetical protein